MPAQSPGSDHDQFFKTLFKGFFPELFQLFFPLLAESLDVSRAVFLDKEYFTDFPTGRRRHMDLLARVPGRAKAPLTVLLHTESQEDDSPQPIDQRLFLYDLTLQVRHFPEPVVPVLVQFCTADKAISIETFSYEHLGAGLSLKYHRVAVKALEAEPYLAGDNPLGWALAVRMKRGRLKRSVLVLRSLARILRSRLSDMKKELLLNCVKMYGRLNPAEESEMQAMLSSEEYQDVKEAEQTWSQKLRDEGRKEGRKEGRDEGRGEALREVVLDLCEVLGIRLAEEQQARLGAMDTAELESLRSHLKRHRAWPQAS